MLDRGALVDLKNKLLETPLHRAAENGSSAVVEILLYAGADPDAVDKIKRTPYDWAKIQKHDKVIEVYDKFLKERFPSRNKKNNNVGIRQSDSVLSSLNYLSDSSFFNRTTSQDF